MRANVDAWTHEIDLDQAADNVDAVIVNASDAAQWLRITRSYLGTIRLTPKNPDVSANLRAMSEFVSEMDVLPNSDRGGLRHLS